MTKTTQDILHREFSDLKKEIKFLRSLAIHELSKMYLPEERLFVFRIRKNRAGEVIREGVSCRYTAIVLIGLAGEKDEDIARVLVKDSLMDVCDRLVDEVDNITDIGAIALIAWAAKAIKHPNISKVMQALRKMAPGKKSYRTVELSWALMAEVIDAGSDFFHADETAEALLTAYNQESKMFQYRSMLNGHFRLHNHTSCFADLAYPIMALSHYYQTTGNSVAAVAAGDSAGRMCQLQGPDGQWWWYYDNRTGKVLERFPVYAIHQDSMAPMALFSLADALGTNHTEAIQKGLNWLFNANEINGSLVDAEGNIIWRKVGRRGIGRIFLSGLQAAACRIHPALRTPLIDVLFPGNMVEYETRPYHMGWILHAWPAKYWETSFN